MSGCLAAECLAIGAGSISMGGQTFTSQYCVMVLIYYIGHDVMSAGQGM